MATIGTFTKTDAGGYTGTIKTPTQTIKTVELRPVEKDGDKSPDFRVFGNGAEFGAGWKQTSREDREYVSLKLDDPYAPATIYANLFATDDGFTLIWSRRPAKAAKPDR
jgi:uncharacterized protein (DUF736 family)